MSVKRYDVMCFSLDVDGNSGPFVKYEDYAALEARYAALAAENAGLNEKMNKLATWPGIKFYSSAWEFNNGDGNAVLEYMCDTETPATDAFLAEVRAQGVEMLNTQFKKCTGMLYADSVVSTAEHFAAQLRKGVQS